MLDDHADVAVDLLEVGIHGSGAAAAGHDHSVAVHAVRPFGGFVVVCFSEVEPNRTSALAAGGFGVGQGVNRRRRGGRREHKRSAIWCSVIGAIGSVVSVCSLHHGWLEGAMRPMAGWRCTQVGAAWAYKKMARSCKSCNLRPGTCKPRPAT